ncbi:hypothetical protein B0H13DRAFT_2685547, partial [Mycena leptocephala]
MILSSTTKLDSTPTSALGLPGGREQRQNPRTWSSGSEDLCNQQVSPSPRPQQLVAMNRERKTLFCTTHRRRDSSRNIPPLDPVVRADISKCTRSAQCAHPCVNWINHRPAPPATRRICALAPTLQPRSAPKQAVHKLVSRDSQFTWRGASKIYAASGTGRLSLGHAFSRCRG